MIMNMVNLTNANHRYVSIAIDATFMCSWKIQVSELGDHCSNLTVFMKL